MEERGEVLGNLLVWQIVVVGISTTKGEENLLSCSLAGSDGFCDTGAVLKKSAVLGAIVRVRVISPAGVGYSSVRKCLRG